MIERGEIRWADLDEPRRSEPGFRRPLLIIQANSFNRSRIETVVAVVLTSNLRLIDAPGNVLLPKRMSGLPRDSVANISQVITVDRAVLGEQVGILPADLLAAVDEGLRLVLDL